MNSPRHPLSALLLCGLLLLTPNAPAHAGSATWKTNPRDDNWGRSSNWTPGTVPQNPGDVATFGFSSIMSISVSLGATIDSIVFSPGASAFVITPQARVGSLILSGAGIVNNSEVTQNFVTTQDSDAFLGFLGFMGSASAGDDVLITNSGGTVPAHSGAGHDLL